MNFLILVTIYTLVNSVAAQNKANLQEAKNALEHQLVLSRTIPKPHNMTGYADTIASAFDQLNSTTKNFAQIGGVLGCMTTDSDAFPVINGFYDMFHSALVYQQEFNQLLSFYKGDEYRVCIEDWIQAQESTLSFAEDMIEFFDNEKGNDTIIQMCYYGQACSQILETYINMFNETSQDECNIMNIFYSNYTQQTNSGSNHRYEGDRNSYMRLAAYTQTLMNIQLTVQSTYIAINSTCDVEPVQKQYQPALEQSIATIQSYNQKGITDLWANLKSTINWKINSDDDDFNCNQSDEPVECFCHFANELDTEFDYMCKGLKVPETSKQTFGLTAYSDWVESFDLTNRTLTFDHLLFARKPKPSSGQGITTIMAAEVQACANNENYGDFQGQSDSLNKTDCFAFTYVGPKLQGPTDPFKNFYVEDQSKAETNSKTCAAASFGGLPCSQMGPIKTITFESNDQSDDDNCVDCGLPNHPNCQFGDCTKTCNWCRVESDDKFYLPFLQ